MSDISSENWSPRASAVDAPPRQAEPRAAQDRVVPLSAASAPLRRRTVVAKRAGDLVLAGALVLVLLPLLLVLGLAVRLTSPGPALFRQVRVGRNGGLFTIYKFRTMRQGASEQVHREYVTRLLAAPGADERAASEGPPAPRTAALFKLASDSRITRVGALLRRTSLDELPQLFNVLRGNMSLVGPRPMLPYETELLEARYSARFSVLPGITGLWQTSGRNRLSMRQALELDLEYVRSCCLRLDLRILLRTLPAVLRGGDAA